jgi:hypothetical protein
VFGAERAHCASRCIGRPLGDGETDTRINRLNKGHPSNIEEKRNHQTPPSVHLFYLIQKCHPCPDT